MPEQHPWLKVEPRSNVVDRLRAVKTAWILHGGQLGQEWFNQNGSRDAIIERIYTGHAKLGHEITPAGLLEAVLAKEFSLQACSEQFHLDWEEAREKIGGHAAQKTVPKRDASSVAEPALAAMTMPQKKARVEEVESEHTSKLMGPMPLLKLPGSGVDPPLDILTEDTKIVHEGSFEPKQIPSQTYLATIAEAQQIGLVAPPTWPGLGEVPAELKLGSFKSLLILGPSGSGKSTLLRELLAVLVPVGCTAPPLYPTGEWPESRPLIEAFESADEGKDLLPGVGLGSVPSWCKPYDVLSTGEKYRANLAQALQRRKKDPSSIMVFDEFTSELDRGLARVVSRALAKRLRLDGKLKHQSPDEEAKEHASLGPYLFASCYPDVACYLQPELICLCQAGEAPRLFKNPHAGADPQFRAVVRCVVEPLPKQVCNDMFAGTWHIEDHKRNTPFSVFLIRRKYKTGVSGFSFQPADVGMGIVEWLQLESDSANQELLQANCAPCLVGQLRRKGQLKGKVLGDVRIELLGPMTLCLTYREEGAKKHGPRLQATRRSMPFSGDAEQLACNLEEFNERKLASISSGTGAEVLKYSDLDMKLVRDAGWYVPPEMALDRSGYGGLEWAEALSVVSGDFRHNPSSEEEPSTSSTYLGTYVGEADGSLCPKLQEVSRLLDCPFDGLCVHRLPQLPHLANFRIGVVTGPSGSGKSTLVRELFGPAYTPLWDSEVPVVGHFSSLSRAREFLGAASLDLEIAMRPFSILSCGEQSRAKFARLLDHAAQLAEASDQVDVAKVEGETPVAAHGEVIILEEFTSLVDRRTAKRMAAGLMNLTRHRHLRNIVLVSCQDDFVGIGSVEPDWLFECHNDRLLRFHRMELEDWEKKASATEGLLQEMDAKLVRLPKLRDIAEHLRTESAGVSSDIVVGAAALVAQAEKELRFEVANRAVLDSTLAAAREQIALARSKQTLGCEAGSVCSPPTDEETIWQCMPELVRPPLVELEVRRALPREWLHFREHHYKDHSLKGSTIAFVGLVGGRPVAFVGIVPEALHFIRRGVTAALEGRHPEWADSGYPASWLEGDESGRKLFREHRTVVLPDAQGMGFGPLLCDAVALIISRCSHDFTSQTVHPHYGSYRNRSPFWRPLPTNQQAKAEINGNQKYSHFFIGAVRNDDGSEDAELLRLLQDRVVIEAC